MPEDSFFKQMIFYRDIKASDSSYGNSRKKREKNLNLIWLQNGRIRSGIHI